MNYSPNDYFEQKQHPEPVTYGMIRFACPHEGREVNYTDCWEISVYRFLHLLFQDGGRVCFDRLREHMIPGNYQSDLLVSFCNRYPVVHAKPDYYENEAEGRRERAEWAQMLNASECLYLKRKQMRVVQADEGGLYEVAATLENTFAFFKHFFPKLSFWKTETNEGKIATLMRELSRPGLDLRLKAYDEFEVPDYKYHLMHIDIDGIPCLEWEIWSNLRPVYDERGNIVRQNRTGGHSDYRFRIPRSASESLAEAD